MKSLRGRVGAEPLGGVGLAGTLATHGLALATLWVGGATRSMPPLLPAYRVELVAAPEPVPTAGSQAVPLTPTPAAPGGQAVPPVPARPAPGGRAVAGRPAPVPAAAPDAAPTARPADRPTAGTDPATIRTEGVEFPFPGYLRNLVAQVYRGWRPPPAAVGLEAEIFFFVHRDGSVTGLQFVRRSGAFAFDLEAQGAIEAAARAGAFGRLPDGYGPEVLPVSFFFSPRAVR